MHPYIESLYTRKREAWEQAKALLDGAEAEKRDLTPEENEQWDRLNQAIDTATEGIRRYQATEAQARAADELREQYAKAIAPHAGDRDPKDRDIVRLMRGEIGSFESASSWNGREFRALTTPGGSAIETSFYDTITVYERTLVPVLGVASVLNTSSGAPIVLPRLTADTATGGTVTAEAAGITEADPTISQVTLNAFKYAQVTLWSRELDEDNVIGLEDLLARSIARDLSISGYGTHLTTGTGTTQPFGIVTAASNGGTASGTAVGSATDSFVAPYDLVALFYSLAAPYRSVGTWMVSTSMATKMRGFRDSNRNFIWEPGNYANEGAVDRFMGRPVIENPAMTSPVASATKSVLFGDLSRYFVRRLPLRVETSSEYKFSTDQLAVKCVVRLDGNVVDAAAIKYLVSANT